MRWVWIVGWGYNVYGDDVGNDNDDASAAGHNHQIAHEMRLKLKEYKVQVCLKNLYATNQNRSKRASRSFPGYSHHPPLRLSHISN